MKRIGVVGGIGPESTIDYYRAIIAANSPHVVFDELQRRSPLPLVSIVQATAREALRLRRTRLGLFGTRVTMQGTFYSDVFAASGVALVVPNAEEQSYIHDIYMSELLKGIVRPETRERLLAIVARMKSEAGIDGVILAGTELPLILRDPTASDIPLLDTTVIHARAIVAAAMA